jgi:hypothetical protein
MNDELPVCPLGDAEILHVAAGLSVIRNVRPVGKRFGFRDGET